MKPACKICGCRFCPYGKPCERRKHQPSNWFIFACAGCGCSGVQELNGSHLKNPQMALKISLKNEENEEMLKAPISNSSAPKPVSVGSTKGKLPYIKIEHLSQKPQRCKILGVKDTSHVPNSFNDYILKVNMEGIAFFYGLKLSNPNFEILYSAFGEDETKWEGREFDISLKYDDFSEKNMPFVTPVVPTEKTSRASR